MKFRKPKKVQADIKGATVRPIHDNLLVKVDPIKEYSGVIWVAGGVDEDKANSKGTVISVGPGRVSEKTGEIEPLDPALVEGARVVFGKYAGTEIKIDGEDVKIIAAKEVHLILEEESEEPDPADAWKGGLTPEEEAQGYPDEGQMQD